MSLNAAALRKMLDKGLTLGDALEIAEAIEEGYARATPMVDVAAERRRAKDRERKRNVRGMSAECPRISEERVPPTPPSENNPLPPLKGEVSPNSEPAGFAAFWSAYPRKTAKGAARKAYVSALRKTNAETLLAAVGCYPFDRDPKFVPHAATWLNDERWTDDAVAPPTGPDPPDADPWPKRLREFHRNGFWNATDWGPKPGKPGCLAPKALLDQAA